MVSWPLKDEARILGIDDGFYRRGSKKTPVVMSAMRLSGRIEGFLRTSITTDGTDSSRMIADAILSSRFRDQIRCILSDGACLGGFNVLDMDDLYERTGIPVITVSDKGPNRELMKGTVLDLFEDGMERYRLISAHEPWELDTGEGSCYVREKGITREMAVNIIGRCTFQGKVPEPLRISHMVASLIPVEGEKDG